jgi:XTP/dITP diphosphohydrolase
VPRRVVLVATSSRVAPGLLSGPAWAALHAADLVLAPPEWVPALNAGGVQAQVRTEGTAYHGLARILVAADLAAVTCLVDGDGAADLVEAVAAEGPDVVCEVVPGSWDLPGAHLLDVVAVMDRLRSPGGCPWDAEQTHVSLVEYLVEEAYETVEAIETDDDAALREELGDVLLQVLFHARIAEEREQPWGIDDVADGIAAKLVRRHPHVFADGEARTPEQVEASWAVLKAEEKGRESVTDGIPEALPALVLAAKLLRRSSGVSDVDWVHPEVEAAADRAVDAADGELGDLLLALVARMRATGVDAEQELRDAVRRHRAAIRAAEGLA